MRTSQQSAAPCTRFTSLCGCEAALVVEGVVRIAAELAAEVAELAALLLRNVFLCVYNPSGHGGFSTPH